MNRSFCVWAGCTVVLALVGCQPTPKPDDTLPVDFPSPRLAWESAAPAAAAGTPVTLSWKLSEAWPGELVVSARAPGNGEEGEAFAGARPSTGAVRYLAADGTWSEAEVAYASPVAVEGRVAVTPPLPVEGTWRFDAEVRSSVEAPRAVSSVPVLVSSKPALRVTLSQPVAAEGDSVNGELLLARGGGEAARQVKVVAFWKGPDGMAVPLPEGGSRYVLEGELKDVRLPVVGKQLEGLAPGMWTVVARMYDASTDELLAAGSASVEVCGGLRTLPGTAVGEDGKALGVGAGFSEVTAQSLDRQEDVSTEVATDGSFSLSLRPGRWLLSGRVEDSSGAHALLPTQVTVGCGEQEAVTLGTNLPAEPRRRRVRVPRAKVPRDNAPTPAPPPRSGVRLLVMDSKSLDTRSNPVDDAFRVTVADAVAQQLRRASGNALATTSTKTLHGMLGQCEWMHRTGQDDTVLMGQVRDLVGGHQVAVVNVRFIEAGGFGVTIRVASGWPEVETLAGKEIIIPSAPQSENPSRQPILDAVPGMVTELLQQDLVAKLRVRSDLPYNPVVKLNADFAAVDPNSSKTVTVQLKDSDGTPAPGRKVYLTRKPVAFEGQVMAETDSGGNASFTVTVGVSPGNESLQAEYYQPSARKSVYSQVHAYGIRRGQAGMLKFNPGIPVIRPLTDYAVEVVAAELDGGTPLTGKQVTVTAKLGGSEVTAEGTTDGEGKVTVTVPVGPDAGLGELTASLPSGATDGGIVADAGIASVDGGSGSANSVTENRVVSIPAALNVTGPPAPVGQGAVSTLKGSLRVEGLAQPGARVTLESQAGGNFETEEGGGATGRVSVALNEDSTFEVLYQPPQPEAGQPFTSGSTAITATVTVDGAPVQRTVNVSWGPPGQAPILWYGPNYGDPPGPLVTGTRLVSVFPDGSGRRAVLVDPGANPQYPAVSWANHHTRIVYTHRDFSSCPEVRVMNADGTSVTTALSWCPASRLGVVQLSVSPDGTAVVGHVDPGYGSHAVVSFKLDGSGVISSRPEETYSTEYRALAWGANGKIGVVRTDMQVVSVDVSQGEDVTAFSPLVQWPRTSPPDVDNVQGFAWSPDGTEVALACVYKGTPSILRVQAIGTGLQTAVPLPSSSSCYSKPGDIAYSPDGTRLAYLGCCAGGKGLCTMALDGSGETLVDATADGAVSISW